MTTKNSTGIYRISVVVDVEADSAEDAYGQVYRALSARLSPADVPFEGWETCDTGWFGPEGKELSIYDIENARMNYLKNLPKKPRAPARGF